MSEQGRPQTGEPVSAHRASRVRAMVIAGLGSSATGVVIGGLWAWIAPPIHAVVADHSGLTPVSASTTTWAPNPTIFSTRRA